MYRAFHAPIRTTEGTPLRDAQGRPTNAVYIFVTMLRKLLKEHQPEFIAASFDLPGRTFRDDLAADYKANRRPMPEDLAQQIPLVHDACEALGVPILTSERYEADDVIGTLAEQAAAAGFEVAIVTGDKDFFQLVGNGIKVFNPKEDGAWFDANAVKEKFGVAPQQVVDVLALMGDTIDNIKGVPGIGEKGARDLIAEYGSLEALLARAADISQKRYREPLLAHQESARQSRELARIRTDVPVTFSVDAVRYRGASRQRAFELFSRLVFRSLVAEYAPTAETSDRDYRLVTAFELPALAAELKAAGRVALRVIPGDTAAMRAPVVGIAFSTAERQARYVPIGHHALGPTGNVSLERVAATLGPVLADPAVKKVGHDLKFDAILLERHGLALNGLETDTLILSYLLDATRSTHRLEDLALEHAGYKALTEEEVCGRGAKAMPFAELPADGLLDYAGERADVALRVAGPLRDLVAREALQDLYQSLELPLVPVLVAIERAGVRIDAAALLSQSQRIDQELASRSRQIFEIAGEEFNINSPPQLSLILFEKLSLPVLKRNVKTKTPSTAVEVLEELALAHDLPRLILEWRTLQKLKGTYIDALPVLVNPATGRVHTCFNQAVAATGRLSSSDPNLQNIPIRTELGREIRRAFVAEPGFVLISADYSQIELRVLAHLSGDEALIDAFERGEDIHDRTALQVFGAASGLSRHELRSQREDDQLRGALRKDRVHARQGHQRPTAGGAGVHRRLLRRLSRRPAVHRRDARPRAGNRQRENDDGAPAAGARPEQPQRADPRGGRAGGDQLPDPGIGGRHPEARDDRRPRGAAVERRTDDPDGARRAAL